MHDFDLLDDTKNLKLLYKETPIWTTSLIGGPIAGAYLLIHNFREAGEEKKIQITWIISVALTIINVLLVICNDYVGGIALTILPFGYMAVSNVVIDKHQSQFIEKHELERGHFKSAATAVGPCLIGFFGFYVPLVVLYFWMFY